ncbi:MAG: tetratricopeptide repeat protein [Prochlorotrichaceae cyanobacterium]
MVGFGPIGLLFTAFWLWMIYDCVQHERDRTWLWLLIFLNIMGAVLYFIARYWPRTQGGRGGGMFGGSRLRDQLWQAEAEAKNIGKAHQFIKLGDILSQMNDRERAATAYAQALEKEPRNAKALWGAASIALQTQDWATAQGHLAVLVQVEPDFLYGDASVAYAQVLASQEQWDQAIDHLQQHFKRWSHPEAYLILAQVHQKKGDREAAKEAIETMIVKVKSSPPYHYRKNQRYVKQGEKLLRTL